MCIVLSQLRDNPDILTDLKEEQRHYRIKDAFNADTAVSRAFERLGYDNHVKDRLIKGQKYIDSLTLRKVEDMLREIPNPNSAGHSFYCRASPSVVINISP